MMQNRKNREKVQLQTPEAEENTTKTKTVSLKLCRQKSSRPPGGAERHIRDQTSVKTGWPGERKGLLYFMSFETQLCIATLQFYSIFSSTSCSIFLLRLFLVFWVPFMFLQQFSRLQRVWLASIIIQINHFQSGEIFQLCSDVNLN